MKAKFVYEAIKHLSGRDEKDFQNEIEKELARNEIPSKTEIAIIKSGDENLIYHVYSGVDAFLFRRDEKEIYPPYIAVVAKNQRDAREKVAKILGQKLIDQVIGQDYGENYIYVAEFVPNSKRYQGYYGLPTDHELKQGIYHLHFTEEHPVIFTTEKNEKIPMPYVVMLGTSPDNALENTSIFMGKELNPEDVKIKFIRYF